MKRILVIFNIFLLSVLLLITNLNADISYDSGIVEELGATYQVTNRTNYDSLDYGIKYIRDIAKSKSSSLVNGTGSTDPQVVNVLEVPTSSVLKVVNWTYQSSSSWTKQTVTNLAKDFEKNNPGWVVLAGINGDFFDINGNYALPYQTTGAAVNNGDVVRSTKSSNQIGFTNDGTTDSLIGHKTFAVTSSHYLAIYDEKDDIIATYEINKFNTLPEENEISIYFSYHVSKTEDTYATVPEGISSYLVESASRCYPTSSSKLFAKGTITATNKVQQLQFGQFAVVSNNDEVSSLLAEGVTIRVQQNVVGDYANCENITGAGVTLIEDGVCISNSDGMSDYRHPRTVIGQKEDGTIVLVTVDGRQQEQNMYGMAYDELSAMMKYYGCIEAYNLDGGGSTTMIIRNDEGGFDVVNSPSDGEERRDSNAILIVVPEMNLSIDKVTDTTLDISYTAEGKDIAVNNVKVILNDGQNTTTYNINDAEAQIENLTPNTTYTLYYEYDLKYKDDTLHNTSKLKTFTTGSPKPIVDNFAYSIVDGYYLLEFAIEDESDALIQVCLIYDRELIILSKTETTKVIAVTNVKNPTFKITLTYNLGATPNSTLEDVYLATLTEEDEAKTEDNFTAGKKSKCGSKELQLIYSMVAVSSFVYIITKKKH